MSEAAYRRELVGSLIHDVPDFPKPGVVFKDITPLLASPHGFQAAVTELVTTAPRQIDIVVGMEARGFIFAAPVALALGAGFVPVRKPGKLPGETISESFELEYGFETLTMHRNAIPADARVLVVDDVLATGGTVGATAALLQQMGAELVHVSVVMELGFLGGRARLAEQGIDNFSAILTV
ncbi:adenine phosphoribosyltransferase [Tessaracoccus flavus]|uniref:Adenine phosphoribosyltransferase n=1 Tax=Tessaracoccus flavus TaxID=1610493 RepID=A0A1Q2CEE6_9ACTN|nr:adenine phosphoribosyltransferase [Tessaracoccus flavus]AQP44471.1 adenine phosphoribosyltransferase [Tessaracoccus flavus]SDY70384.1 adenine phosphoribosyltransferase [Tessaracoccus flavus]